MNIDETIIVKILLSVLLGGIIGFERETRSKSAGFRTLILICLGATLFTIFSQIIGMNNNPDRIASNIVTGIGFLGAGVIFRSENKVNGITTAASIWVTAAIGMGIGCGYYVASIAGCLIALVILVLFSFLDSYIDQLKQVREYKITYPYEEHNQHRYEEIIKEFKLKIDSRQQSKAGNIIKGAWTVRGKESDHHKFIEYILLDKTITEFDF